MHVLMNWILFTIFIFGAFASEEFERARMYWFDDLDQRHKDKAVEFFFQSIQHHNGLTPFEVMDIQIKFGITQAQTQQLYEFLYSKVQNQFSKDNGVSWIKDNNQWQVQLVHNKKLYYNGVFENEECAAMIVNLLCEKYEKERTLAMVNLEVGTIREDIKISVPSEYTGVSWNICRRKWVAQLVLNKTTYNEGLFEDEQHAAMAVNLLCDKYGIQRKNQTIEPNAIREPLFRRLNIGRMCGVSWKKEIKKWHAQLNHNKKK